ncbi:right-handed parallel beta-helix repeat-containing protein, partial [Candidatus Sumerlaeota bacterium]|nr:right-handed parallel beta-helix repeat-containing protein [Candidatus Sumerlaeota bacterium]
TWGYDQSASQRNIIEYNHIHHIGNEILSDMGGIYTLGFSAGSILRYNHIHHVLSYSYGGWGIYPDEGTSHMLIENNVVHQTKTGAFHQHYGKENLVINNIFAFSLTDQIVRSRVEDHRSFRFERNIVYFDQGDLLGSQWGGDHFFLDHNLYWRTDGADMDFKGSSLADWRKEKNMDWNSIVADPLFKNPEHPEERDFKMSGESPARKIGFEEIDMSGIGLEGERAWRKLPDQFQTHRQKWPEPPPPMEVNEDFEQIGVGQTMPFGTTSGETAEASIRVTDETAAQGKHSLKFTDAANLSREFNPHFYFDPGLRSGVARENFDLKFEAGETVYHEWRTEGGSYVAGPTITIRADGALLIGGEKKMDLPADTWIHFEIECGLGTSAKAVYTVTVNVEGSEPAAFKDIPCDARFRSLRWVGFCSMATEKKLFYLDNLKLRSVPAVR